MADSGSESLEGVGDETSPTPSNKEGRKRKLGLLVLAVVFVGGVGLFVRYRADNSGVPTSLEVAQEAAEANPEDPYTWFAKGSIQQTQNDDLKGAIESYSRALELDPGYRVALFNRGLAYKALGQLEDARLDFAQIVTLQNGQAPRALLNIGLIYLDQGDKELGEVFLQRAYEQDPSLRP